MKDVDITAKELQNAFEEFDSDQFVSVDFTKIPGVVQVMGKHMRERPEASAGCETGIKLGLIIAARRISEVTP
jgi:hypothetical protein